MHCTDNYRHIVLNTPQELNQTKHTARNRHHSDHGPNVYTPHRPTQLTAKQSAPRPSTHFKRYRRMSYGICAYYERDFTSFPSEHAPLLSISSLPSLFFSLSILARIHFQRFRNSSTHPRGGGTVSQVDFLLCLTYMLGVGSKRLYHRYVDLAGTRCVSLRQCCLERMVGRNDNKLFC